MARWSVRLAPAALVVLGFGLVALAQNGCDESLPVKPGGPQGEQSSDDGPEPPVPVRTIDVIVADSSGPSAPVAVAVDGPYAVTDPDGQTLAAGDSLESSAVWVESTGLSGKRAWRHHVGTLVLESRGELTVRPRRSGTLSVKGVRYHGAAVLQPLGPERLLVINRLPLEDYLAGVVASEMPKSFPQEALKAQAVAARSYACYRIAQGSRSLSAHHTVDQAYRGLSAEWAGSRRAVEATRGEVLLVEGKLFKAFYHSTCGGLTLAAEKVFPVAPVKPLAGGVTCAWCTASPRHRTTVRLNDEDVARALADRGIVNAKVVSLAVTSSGSSRKVQTVSIGYVRAGRRRVKTMDAASFRMAVGPDKLYSAWIDHIATMSGGFKVITRGYGHGVGMCQFGAAGLAGQGKTYREILQRYYPGSRVGHLPGEDVR